MVQTAAVQTAAVQTGTAQTVVRAPEEIDLSVAGQLAESLRAAAPADDLVVDMRGTAFMDASGVQQLLVARRRQVAAGGHLRIVASRQVLRVLELTGVDRLLDAEGAGEHA